MSYRQNHTANDPIAAIPLPDELSDETVAALLELLYDIARLIENHYAGQLHRYYCAEHPQPELDDHITDQSDPPF